MTESLTTNRKAQRKPVRMAARCSSSTGLRDEGSLEDISAEGCCLVTRTIYFKVGSRIVIRPQGLEGVSGVVRWIAGTRAGIQFDQPLYGPTVEHLWKQHGGVSFTAH